MPDAAAAKRFERTVLVHLGAGYNLARWITRDAAGAEDAVQDACLRAFRFFDTHQGPSTRAWFMAIVRNAALDWLQARRLDEEPYDEELHAGASAGDSPESALVRAGEAAWVRRCIAALPREYREVIVLRELEELSYKEIGEIVDVPIGTVMSRLSRGRALLQQRLGEERRRRSS